MIKSGEGPTSGAVSLFLLLHHEGQAAPCEAMMEGVVGGL